MKVLFATGNVAKIKKFKDRLAEHHIEILSLKDLNIAADATEDGSDAIENARLKAKYYFDKAGIITFSMDDSLYLEGIEESKQPGTHIKRVGGKELNDEQIIEYYSNLAKEHGGKINAWFKYGLSIYDGKKYHDITWNKDNFYLVSEPCGNIEAGHPLRSIEVDPVTGEYFVNLKKDNVNDKKTDMVVQFISDTLKELNEENKFILLSSLSYKDKLDINNTYSFDESYLDNSLIKYLDDVKVSGFISENALEEYKINANVSGSMVISDSVTLEDIFYDFNFDIDDNIDESLINEKNMLDIMELLWQNIVLEVPIRYTQSDAENLKGDNWRVISDVDDDSGEIDPRLQKLSELYKGGE